MCVHICIPYRNRVGIKLWVPSLPLTQPYPQSQTPLYASQEKDDTQMLACCGREEPVKDFCVSEHLKQAEGVEPASIDLVLTQYNC